MDFNNHYEHKSHVKNYDQYKKHDQDFDNFSNDEVVSLGTWIVVLIILAIPFVNIIALLVMAFGNHNENLKNFAKASLLLGAIGLLLALLLGGCGY